MLRTILLNKAKSKRSVNKETTVDIQLLNNAPLAPLTPITRQVSEMAVYDAERSACGNARITVAVDVVASNVLFNNITEVVETKNGKAVRNKTFEESYRGTVSTDDSGDEGVEYMCGVDIFNNHTLRSKTFKSIGPTKDSNHNDDYNTIRDILRDDDGKPSNGMKFVGTDRMEKIEDAHVYRKEDIATFDEAIKTRLEERDGWFGFTNRSGIARKRSVKDKDEKIQNRTILSEPPCSFVDLYPTRDMFWFPPTANRRLNRTENNWDYLMLYPSSATTEGVSFIEKDTGAVVAASYDDTVRSKDGRRSIRVYSAPMHGLSVGDTINLYVNGALFESSMEVNGVDDAYTFTVTLGKKRPNTKWVRFTAPDEEHDGYRLDQNTGLFVYDGNGSKRPMVGDKADVSPDTGSMSFKKISGVKECSYYVRVFSKVPNFKWVEGARNGITEEIIAEGQKSSNAFETHASRLAFAQNAYNDAMGEIVYSDDIEFGKLKSNLGLPLTDIYISFKKSNKGYLEWYRDNKLNSPAVERSHAFGKVNCGFELSTRCAYDPDRFVSVDRMHNLPGGGKGLDMTILNPDHGTSGMDDDEVIYDPTNGYDGDVHFYGDFCCFSPADFDEESIQPVNYRFNTAQREVDDNWESYKWLNQLKYQELVSDDYDYKFQVSEEVANTVACQMANGYYYEPHKRIPIRTMSPGRRVDYGKKFSVKRFERNDDGTYDVWTNSNNFMEKGRVFHIYDRDTKETMMMEATEILTVRKFRAVQTDPDDPFALTDRDIKDLVVVKPDAEALPVNFVVRTDGEVRYEWREVVQNGYDALSDLEWYPFTNGAFYISENVRIFLKRQEINEFPDIVHISTERDDESREDGYIIHTDIIC